VAERSLSVGYSGSNPAVSYRRDVEATSEVMFSLRDADGTGLAAATTDQEHSVAFGYAGLLVLAVVVTGNDGVVTVEHNATTGGAKTITFAAGGGVYVWDKQTGEANPFGTTDVTKVYVTNAGTTAADVDYRAFLNS
jgi:hypothetical protein